jgi:translation initiation factor eIF-2B subunit beta
MESQIELLCSKLSRRQIKGSLEVTIETSKLLRNVIAGSRWNDADSLTLLVKQVQQRLTEAQPIEFSSEHTARRILNLIHDDTMEWDRRDVEEETSFRDAIKNSILQEISEIMDEAESANSHIASQALEHIHSNEIIMTVGYSKIILNFLKEANKYRKFQVILAENSPFYDGQVMVTFEGLTIGCRVGQIRNRNYCCD